jgi:isopentenyl-diphosphate delta-isomerase
VFAARTDGELRPHPDEVAELRWIDVDELRDAIRVAPWAVSPWLVGQTAALDEADAWHLLRPSESETHA